MLEKLASVLDTSIDELVLGKSIHSLPKNLKTYSLEYVSPHKPVQLQGILDWFIKLEIGNEICFGLYDAGVKDCSYRLTVVGQANIHQKKGFEVLVEQYNSDMIKDDCFSLVVSYQEGKMQFLAKISNLEGVRSFETFQDEDFIKNWGLEASTYFEECKNYILKYGENKYNVIQITYFANPDIYIECYLDENLETLLWRRFDKNRESKETRILNGIPYGFFYETITDRLR